MTIRTMALDATARTIDTDGRMHIAKSHISKAGVNPYYGNEIPGYEALGLTADKIYHLLRDPGELAKGASTFERNQILFKHLPVTADSPRKDHVIGAIGSDVEFNAPYLDADVCIWDAEAIAAIETETMKEFSCAYHYVPVMTPGQYEGDPYDGVMTEIQGNHLALVETGRAGSDVVAADSNPFTRSTDMVMTKRGKALFVALCAASPKLAQDSALPALVGQVRTSNFDAAGIKARLIAMDAESKEKTEKIVDSMKDMDDEPEAKEPKANDADPDDETEEERKDRLEKRKAAKDRKTAKDKKPAYDAEEVERLRNKPACDQTAEERAMWAQMKKDGMADSQNDSGEQVKHAMDSFRRELREAEEARREVRPVVGEVLAQDSAAGIYEFALDTLKVDHKDVAGVPALRALYRVASSKSATAPTVAMDYSAVADVEKRFPGFSRVRQA